MILIFAVDNNWNIGVDGDMLTSIPEDLKRFKKITEGNIVIMGRKTLEAIPGQKPLSNRVNILVTRNKEYKNEGFYIIHSLEELEPLLEEIDPNNKMDVFVTGGGSIVRQLLPRCNKAYITKILESFQKVDTSIPNLDLEENWKIDRESEIYNYGDLKYKYVDYLRK